MFNAAEAVEKTKVAVEQRDALILEQLEGVITASIQQGSCKATFYARNPLEGSVALGLLRGLGYTAEHISAKDQRDRDRIEIQWA